MTEPQQVANAGVPDSVAAWEERYAGDDAVWSGNPNEALVATVGSLTPGRVLDVGCGEGADVIWLAENGWDVVGIDLSQTAIDRATEAAAAKG
ncbi:MAG: class I SAM-dependent methyltransferase, partial [Brevibacterium sp.]|nr:class I SAM-dependent methyltransferase [Brevibacterium sp.]